MEESYDLKKEIKQNFLQIYLYHIFFMSTDYILYSVLSGEELKNFQPIKVNFYT